MKFVIFYLVLLTIFLNPNKVLAQACLEFYDPLNSKIERFFEVNKDISASNFRLLGSSLNKDRVISLLSTAKKDPQLFEALRRKTYLHPLGFFKTVIAQGKEGWDLRLHAWLPENAGKAVDWVESIHEHRWNFASRVVTGHLENQRYTKRPLTEEESQIYNSFKNVANQRSKTQLEEFFRKLDLIAIFTLKEDTELKAILGGHNKIVQDINFSALFNEWGLSRYQLETLAKIHSKFSNWDTWKTDPNKALRVEEMALDLAAVTHHNGGELYFHQVDHLHRLVVPIDVPTVTFLLVGPTVQKPGSIRRDVSESITSQDMQHNPTVKQFEAYIDRIINLLKHDSSVLSEKP